MINKCCYNILVITQNGKYNIGVSFYQNFKYYNFIRKTKMDKNNSSNNNLHPLHTQSILLFSSTSFSSSVHCHCSLHFPIQQITDTKSDSIFKSAFPSLSDYSTNNIYITAFFSLKSLLSLFILNLILRALFIYWIIYRFQFINTVTQEVSSFFFYVFFRVQYARETEIFVRFETDRKLAGDLMESTSSVFHCLSFHGANCSANFMFELQALVRCCCCCWGETMLVYAFSACIFIYF